METTNTGYFSGYIGKRAIPAIAKSSMRSSHGGVRTDAHSDVHKEVASRVLLSLLLIVAVAICTMILAYFIANRLANSMAAEFSSVESVRHANAAEFVTSIKAANSQFLTERTRCEKLAMSERRPCSARAKTAELHSNALARGIYKDSGPHLESASTQAERKRLPRNFGFALYRQP